MPYSDSIRGWMSEEELKCIESWACELPQGATIVEVGSFHGRSAYCFAASAPTATMYCFDRWDNMVEGENPQFSLKQRIKNGYPLPGDINSLANFLSNTRGCNNIVATQVNQPTDIRWSIDKPVDLFFLDAGHFNPSDWEYLEFWLPFVKPGGYISGHDLFAERYFPDVNDNVARLEQLLGRTAETFPQIGSLWRIRK